MAPKMRKKEEETAAGTYASGQNLNTTSFEELELSPKICEGLQAAWESYTARHGTSDAGKLIINAFFDMSPDSMQIVKMTKNMMTQRMMDGMNLLMSSIRNPKELKAAVSNIGFQIINVDVTVPRVLAFRSAMLDALSATLMDQFGRTLKQSMQTLLSYVGGALIFMRSNYADRLRLIKESWSVAHENNEDHHGADETAKANTSSESHSSGGDGGGGNRLMGMIKATTNKVHGQAHEKGQEEGAEGGPGESGEHIQPTNTAAMPTSFEEMFDINAAVIGVKKQQMTWMYEVLGAFDNFVEACSDYVRFYCEIDILTIQLSKYDQKSIDLKTFRSCMLAALRSLLPKVWSSAHEDAWTWMWDTISQTLLDHFSLPVVYEASVEKVLDVLDESTKFEIRKDIYLRFFELCPIGQDFFKQSNTRLHFIAERVLQMTLEIFQRPKKMVSEISALGLRHVGYGIPTELIPHFVTSCIDVLRKFTQDEDFVVAFEWSLRLISKLLIRTIDEGSTVVMQAINVNSVPALKAAIAQAPRKDRAVALLDVQVGDQHISPLAWAIESGSIKVARAIIKDLLTIRADRARYYYGIDELWKRHPDIVKKLQDEAPTLVPTLLDGLIWRSHHTTEGIRRVNYYVMHLLVNKDGQFSDSLAVISGAGDPALVSHPACALMADTLWNKLIVRHFFVSRMWNVISLMVFILSQEILPSYNDKEETLILGYLIFSGRMWNYIIGMGRLASFHLSRIWVWCRNTMRRILKEIDTDGNGEIDYEEMVEALHKFKDTVKEEFHKAIKALKEDGPGTQDEAKKAIANREKNMYTLISFSLLVLLGIMCTHEPMFWCANDQNWPTEHCADTGPAYEPTALKYRYSVLAMTAMAVHWLVLIDLAVFSTEISAFLLVCGHVLAEVKQFLTALAFLLLAFGSSISILCRDCPDKGGNFNNFTDAMISLFAITVGLYQGDYRDMQENRILLCCVSSFVTISVVLLLNLLVAQLNRSYEYIYKDMLGFARLKRASLITDAMESCSKSRWRRFKNNLAFEEHLEFDEGDLGLAGGIATSELGSLHVVTREVVRRFGGSTSGLDPWPEDKEQEEEDQEEDGTSEKIARMESIVYKISKRVAKISGGGRGGASGGASGSKGDSGGGGSAVEEEFGSKIE